MNTESLYLLPGQIYFGTDRPGVKTLLGSCVAVTLWHPSKHIGGMCHITLPGTHPKETDPKYATGAINTFLKEIKRHGSRPQDYVTEVYGGGKMTSVDDPPQMRDIGNRNAWKTLELLAHAGFRLANIDILDTKYRMVEMDLRTGTVRVQATDVSKTMG